MKSNRKIHGVSDASYERLGNRKMLCLSVWGSGDREQRGLWIIKSLPTQTDPHYEVQIQLI